MCETALRVRGLQVPAELLTCYDCLAYEWLLINKEVSREAATKDIGCTLNHKIDRFWIFNPCLPWKFFFHLEGRPKASKAESADPKFLLTSLGLPTIGTEHNKIIQEMTEEEISKAMSRLKTIKMSRDDSYPDEWYQIFRDIITSMLKNCLTWLRGDSTIFETSSNFSNPKNGQR